MHLLSQLLRNWAFFCFKQLGPFYEVLKSGKHCLDRAILQGLLINPIIFLGQVEKSNCILRLVKRLIEFDLKRRYFSNIKLRGDRSD